MHLPPNLMRLVSFIYPIPSPHLFPLNNALSRCKERCTIRFAFICNCVPHFRFVFLSAWSDGVDWFEIPSHDSFARHNAVHELGYTFDEWPHWHMFKGFVNIFCFDYYLN